MHLEYTCVNMIQHMGSEVKSIFVIMEGQKMGDTYETKKIL